MTLSKTVGEIVTENFQTADIFKKYQIDFCCGGGISLAEVCKKKNLDLKEIENELLALNNQVPKSHDFKNWELDFLIDYIVQTHHTYIMKSLPTLYQYLEKVARVHGKNYPQTIEIKNQFKIVAEELIDHMQKEEKTLFPYIKKIVEAKKVGQSLPIPDFGSIKNPIKVMEHEHENAGNIFKNIASLTNDYQPPEGACTTFKVMYSKLQEFENDLHQHIHLENNILFPKAIELA